LTTLVGTSLPCPVEDGRYIRFVSLGHTRNDLFICRDCVLNGGAAANCAMQ
jgi:hypothetical protein